MRSTLRHPVDWRALYWAAVPVLLALPAIAAWFTPRVQWSARDALILGLLLVLAGLAGEGVVRVARSTRVRNAGLAGVAVVFAVIWVQVAIGVV
jgi:hypothetical protein